MMSLTPYRVQNPVARIDVMMTYLDDSIQKAAYVPSFLPPESNVTLDVETNIRDADPTGLSRIIMMEPDGTYDVTLTMTRVKVVD